MVGVISKAAQIKEALKSGTKAAAEKTFGKRAVSQELRRMAVRLKKERDAKIAEKAGAMQSIKKKKMTKQEKATAAFKRSEAKRKKQTETKAKKPVKVKRVVSKEAQAKLDKEMAEELKGRTVKSRRERIKKATNPKKRRKAKQLTEGRESSEAFESRMSREARQGGGRDVGSKGAQRGSSPDPMFEYEASQASRLMRGEGDAPMTVDDRMKMLGRKKGGSINKKKTNKKPRGVGCATRGYGKAMKGTK
tara:strand:- start:960 stop:1706 length:747 start_codon:yes stop_codon:yes gene_type:complete